MASQRAEMLGQIFSAQLELENAIAEASSHGGDISSLKTQMQALGALLRQVGRTDPASLAGMRASVTDAIAQARTAADQRVGFAAASAQQAHEVMAASAAACGTINEFAHDFYEARKFDSYLRFNSVEDEQEYRRRETENRRAMDEALAKGTPEGNLEALSIARRQMVDAGTHGADQSPDYAATMRGLNSSYENLGTAIRSAGGDPSRAASVDSPRKDDAIPTRITVKSPPPPSDNELDDVFATLKSAGVTTNAAARDAAGHGLSVSNLSVPVPGRAG